ncbi:MAG: hypothetical protein HJJLKODD_02886 [Phycisphaerae bacterium]|nr:hypothetical protein [Phycisphaerae bacterium]
MSNTLTAPTRTTQPIVRELPLANDYFTLLSPPTTLGQRVVLITLMAGQEWGWHSTESREESLCVLQGQGRLDAQRLGRQMINQRQLVYLPPYTEHNVTNTETAPLRFMSITCPAPEL